MSLVVKNSDVVAVADTLWDRYVEWGFEEVEVAFDGKNEGAWRVVFLGYGVEEVFEEVEEEEGEKEVDEQVHGE
ncbi:hypothetical protein Sjap_022777 [Stephania japonica]|uniref:Uncharacterized protein n=1 Tax=Stephania japonica TaxID=461633 RepID=A0AAP0HV96_9MAGN